MAKGKLPPELMKYWDKKNKKNEEEDAKTPEGKERVTKAKGKRAVQAAARFVKGKKDAKKQVAK